MSLLLRRALCASRALLRPLCALPSRAITSYAGRPNYRIDPAADNLHKSNAESLIAKVPVIEVDNEIAVCTGGDCSSLGHPVQYIRLSKSVTTPSVCGYCGLRYRMKAHHA